MYDVLIIGSGLSGLSCAQELFKITTNIVVVDKGFLAGGRTASKMIKTPIGEATFDYGAQYFTVDELEFQKQVNEWMKSGTVQKWSTMFASSVEVEHRETKMRYCGSPTMRSICLEMANKLPVMQKTKVTRIAQNDDLTWKISLDNSDTLQTKQLVLTLPLIQALDLCYRSGIIPSDKTVTFFNQQKYHPCISLLVASDADSMIPEPGGMWFDDQNAIRWVADNKKKGISKVTAITVHISPEMSNKWYEDSEEVIFSNLDSQLKELIPGNWVHKSIHKWRYSQPINIVDLGYLNDEYYKNLWFTGDVFLNGRVESAWLAGLRTAQALKAKI